MCIRDRLDGYLMCSVPFQSLMKSVQNVFTVDVIQTPTAPGGFGVFKPVSILLHLVHSDPLLEIEKRFFGVRS